MSQSTQFGFLELIEDLLDLNYEPSPIFLMFVGVSGLLISIVFLYLFRETIQKTYGSNAFWWFIILLIINFINLIATIGYYITQEGSFVGPPGIQGSIGEQGKPGGLRVCGFCKNLDEIGVSYSTQSYFLAKLTNTTSLTGILTFWRPYGQNGLSPIGDTVYQKEESSDNKNYLIGLGGKPPEDFQKIVSLDNKMTFWRPVAPDGYIVLGDLVMNDNRKPENYHSTCLSSKCLETTETSQLAYAATYPEFVEIKESDKEYKFFSVWITNLNTFYVNYAGNHSTYSNNSLWYNLVRGFKEYYDFKEKKPIQSEVEKLIKFLKSKVSVIPRDTNNQLGLTVNAVFIENITNQDGKIIKYIFNGISYSKDVESLTEVKFWTYLIEIVKTVVLLYHRLGVNGLEFKYLDSIMDLGIRQSAYLIDNLFPDGDSDIKAGEEEGYLKDYHQDGLVADFEKLVNSYLASPGSVLLKLTGQKITDWNKRRYRFSKLLSDTLKNPNDRLSRRDHLKILIDKLNKDGMVLSGKSTQFMGDDPALDIMRQKSNMGSSSLPLDKRLSSKIKNRKKLYDSFNLYDDLLYLFPAGFNEQIAVDDEGLVYGGYLITSNSPEAIQKRNFLNYLRTLVKPNRSTYRFLDKCLVFPNTDPGRKNIILDIKKIYLDIDRQVTSLNAFENCANPKEVERYYQNMIIKMDKYFRSIKGYQGKLGKQEFHYFSTGRLRWLLEELSKYLKFINTRCLSNERMKISSQVRLLVQQTFDNNCLPNFKGKQYQKKLNHINDYPEKIAQNNFRDFKTTELKFLRDELRKVKTRC